MSEQILKSEIVDVILKNRKEFEKRHNDKDWFTMYKAFQGAFEHIENGQTVAEIAGFGLEGAFLAKNMVGNNGNVILIDEPDFLYKMAVKLVGPEKLESMKNYYVNSSEGIKFLQDCFSEAGFHVFGNHIPPYPSLITDNSLDHVMVMRAIKPFCQRIYGTKAEIYGSKPRPKVFIEETYRKLKNGGTLTALAPFEDDVVAFDLCMYDTAKEIGLNFEEKPMERNIGWKWKTYVKIPKMTRKS
jgi:hypothetical protein